MKANNFEPVIVAFWRYYCAYSAADLAGSMRAAIPGEHPHHAHTVHQPIGR